ncbi:TetR family transcriptional regulator [Croceivirga lutea]|uniref:TetR/AcrR family transcriptional regulator n=1 Tax=Croceivirga lutea TaxID=1775167 RepID=UPI00163A5251|nr:TetR/AcrR family transcriptional regulator [Croceivirga lutea]GGG38067.1 TetR family transcriptional regulator [Croceivirga lutea]
MEKRNLKQQIITTAGNLFYTKGYNTTGINEIISKSNVAKATLYHHFKSKEAICIAYLEAKHSLFMASLTNSIASENSTKAKLLGIFEYLRSEFRKEDFGGCWAIKLLGEIPQNDKNIKPLIVRQKKELIVFLNQLVGDSVKNASKAEIEQLSNSIYLLYETAITESYLHKSDWPIFQSRSIAQKLIAEIDLK